MFVHKLLLIICHISAIFGYPQLVNPKLSKNHANMVLQFANTPEEDLGFDSSENSVVEVDSITVDPPSLQDPCQNLSQDIISEIAGYKDVANRIFQTVLSGSFKGRTYNELSYFVDKFGSRVAGSENLEHAIDYMLDKMKQDELDNVHGEKVQIPHWVRGEETAALISPRKKDLSILGLGYTVGTPPGGITAPVLVVSGFDELQQRAEEAKGKIIVFNEAYESYGKTVKYRGTGANEAAKVGALATLIRSVTPFSIDSPHTGMLDYVDKVTHIPSACISIEDAQLLYRLQKMGEKLVIKLVMNDTNLEPKTSRNSVAEIVGREKPDNVVVISGHIDSWDVGQGAMDDGGGAFISVEALALLRFLKLQPRRTLRTILWTSEEFGLIGAQQYVQRHSSELEKFNAVFESDIGTFKPLGLDFAGSSAAGCIVKEVVKLLAPLNATTFRASSDVGSDIGYFLDKGVPGFSLNNANEKYFWFHHSQGDTMTVENADELDMCTAVWAVSSYVIADLSVDLPRH
ncbi:Carboxypeptidase Q [Orchesella cincta]|uniref:Carboxypeptidase Q n=1 Tax=Orchesella cincta TaxID=48709 RepID=A0A1D2N881_ORCCI|nr:Carboxypeptidase Q [Orchesella cincta]